MRTPITWIEKVTGLFVLLIITLLITALFVTAQKHNVFGWYESHTCVIHLASGSGLKLGSPVKIADVDVGVVNDIHLEHFTLDPKRKVKVELRIEGDFWPALVTTTARGPVGVVESELLGAAIVVLVPPTLTAAQEAEIQEISRSKIKRKNPYILSNGAEIQVTVPPTLKDQIDAVKKDVEQLKDEAVVTLKDVQRTVENVRILTDGLVAGKGVAGRVLRDDKMAQDVADTVAEIRGPVIADIRAAIENVRKATEPVAAATANAKETTEKVNRAMDDLPRILASLERTLADVEATVANVREASGGFPEAVRKTDRALAEANRTIEGVERLPVLRSYMPEAKPVVAEHEALPRGGTR
jgi:phospholipid/cholesterol/gamma-HCH transport system substrate-binding protein